MRDRNLRCVFKLNTVFTKQTLSDLATPPRRFFSAFVHTCEGDQAGIFKGSALAYRLPINVGLRGTAHASSCPRHHFAGTPKVETPGNDCDTGLQPIPRD